MYFLKRVMKHQHGFGRGGAFFYASIKKAPQSRGSVGQNLVCQFIFLPKFDHGGCKVELFPIVADLDPAFAEFAKPILCAFVLQVSSQPCISDLDSFDSVCSPDHFNQFLFCNFGCHFATSFLPLWASPKQARRHAVSRSD